MTNSLIVAKGTETREITSNPLYMGISANGYRIGDIVADDNDSGNECKWGKCIGSVTKSHELEDLGQFVVYWWRTCNRHPKRKHTQSDPIEQKHVKIRIEF